jgi:4-hydroxy 2-oxovalerate aldolase
MVNASDVLVEGNLSLERLQKMFPESADQTPVKLVRFACHVHEFKAALPACMWLKDRGYQVGFNLMQIADRTESEVKTLASAAAKYPLAVLYFADSMGGMNPEQAASIVRWLRCEWGGAMGIHTHDNMGLALSNTMRAIDEGVTWADSTVSGMGRGPGNARTEELAIEMAARRGERVNLIPVMTLLRKYFKPLQAKHGWGTNPYYYLAGKYGIHPTYIQEMLSDARYGDEDIIAVIDHLRMEGGNKFSAGTLDSARHFFMGEPIGHWKPADMMAGRDVLILGTGPGVAEHREAVENFIRRHNPLVIALNTQMAISAELINVRVACHPVRLLADCIAHTRLPQPLITPASMLPQDVRDALKNKDLLDFGLNVQRDKFAFNESSCTVPSSIVVAYALAIVTSGNAKKVLLAGFDGFEAEDPRNDEMDKLLDIYCQTREARKLLAITPTRYKIPSASVYVVNHDGEAL